jgi:tetratricopeptide (TPR) repeat protein
LKSNPVLTLVIVCSATSVSALASYPAVRTQLVLGAASVGQGGASIRRGAPGHNSPTADLAWADELLKAKRYAEAASLYRAIIEKHPAEPGANYGLALSLFNLRQPAEAEPFAKAAADSLTREVLKSPGKVSDENRARAADALVIQAVIQAVRGKDADALKSSELAARISPGHFDAQFTYGRALYGAGDLANAAKTFRKAVALNPTDTRALFFLGTTLEQSGDLDSARVVYKQIVANNPQAAEGHLGIGSLLVRKTGAEAEEGINELERAVELDGDLYEARVALGRALLTRGRPDQSVVHLRRAAELAPGNPEPHYQLSLAYRRMGLNEKAAEETAVVRRIHEARRTPATP